MVIAHDAMFVTHITINSGKRFFLNLSRKALGLELELDKTLKLGKLNRILPRFGGLKIFCDILLCQHIIEFIVTVPRTTILSNLLTVLLTAMRCGPPRQHRNNNVAPNDKSGPNTIC